MASQAGLNTPEGITVDPAGNLYIADTENYRIRKVMASTNVITTIGGIGSDGFSGDGGLATEATLNLPWSIALDDTGSVFFGDLMNNRVREITVSSGSTPLFQKRLTIPDGGAGTASTFGSTGPTQAGYALAEVGSGSTPYGTAVFSLTQNNVVVSEVGVPASIPTTSARIFIDYRFGAPSTQGQFSAGTLDINTGLAVVNRGTVPANIIYTLRGTDGRTWTTGHGTLAAAAHFAKFISQLKDVAPDFSLPEDFATSTGLGSLEITSDQPVSILALRLTINQRGETIFTSTPTADLTKSPSTAPIYFPQFADGGGYVSTILLMNTSGVPETGKLSIFDDDGLPLAVNQVGGTKDSSFSYAIAAGGVFVFQTDGFPSAVKVGSVRLMPNSGTSTPAGSGIFRFTSGGVVVTESGISASIPLTHARIFIDRSGGHDTGIAIAAPDNGGVNVAVRAFEKDGSTAAGYSMGPIALSGNGHKAAFVYQLISGLPDEFTGVLDITSSTPFVALTLRSLTNARRDFLLTTFPVADFNRPAPTPIVFPQIADGGGYTTQFILLSATGTSTTTIHFFGVNGAPLAVGK